MSRRETQNGDNFFLYFLHSFLFPSFYFSFSPSLTLSFCSKDVRDIRRKANAQTTHIQIGKTQLNPSLVQSQQRQQSLSSFFETHISKRYIPHRKRRSLLELRYRSKLWPQKDHFFHHTQTHQ